MITLPRKESELAGWGNTPRATCASFRPERMRELNALLEHGPTPLLARGMGRSYGDAALNASGVILTERLDRFLSFDASSGIVHAQAGLTLDTLMQYCIPRGYLPPVIPGTRHVTLGGAVASNVHGKNQWRAGEFAEHVAFIVLRLADGQRVQCSPTEHAELFWATAGGMGMTGIIEEVGLKLRPIGSRSLRAAAQRVASLPEMLQCFYAHRDTADYMVGWIDHFARGDKLGRGIFEHASHIGTAEGGVPVNAITTPRRTRNVPFAMPSLLLNRYSMALYNKRHFRHVDMDARTRLLDFDSFFHPLDAIGNWNRLYGKRGFFQYQCILPEGPQIAGTLQQLLSMLREHGVFSFLAVVKYHRPTHALLGFSMQGFSVALDFANTEKVRRVLPHIDRFVASEGGRVYLAKDAMLTPAMFSVMYQPQLSEWREIVSACDPGRRFDSLLARRIDLRGS